MFVLSIGKTTLLNVIAGRANSGVVDGKVLVNRLPFNPNQANSATASSLPTCSYVMQDDAHIPVLTVKETLQYAAMLRFRERSADSPVVTQAVDETLDLLGLSKISGTVIGTSENRNISCGQLRRLTIAVELVSRPSLLFLDEPTCKLTYVLDAFIYSCFLFITTHLSLAGLDSYLASSVVEGLQTLARSHRTIMCTIHQPSIAVFERFDKLLLLANGYPLYFGPIKQCRSHFEGLGSVSEPFLSYSNPAEFVLAAATAICVDSEALERCAQKALTQLSPEERSFFTDIAQSVLDGTDNEEASGLLQYWHRELQEVCSSGPIVWILLKREFLGMTRRSFFFALSLRTLLTSFLIGIFNIVYY